MAEKNDLGQFCLQCGPNHGNRHLFSYMAELNHNILLKDNCNKVVCVVFKLEVTELRKVVILALSVRTDLLMLSNTHEITIGHYEKPLD